MEYVTKEDFQKLEERVKALEEKTTSPDPKALKKQPRPKSIIEYLKEYQKKLSNPEKAIILFLYAEASEEQKEFNAQNIKNLFKKVHYKQPTNPSDVLFKCEKHGWLKKDTNEENKSFYTITETGAKMVETLKIKESE